MTSPCHALPCRNRTYLFRSESSAVLPISYDTQNKDFKALREAVSLLNSKATQGWRKVCHAMRSGVVRTLEAME